MAVCALSAARLRDGAAAQIIQNPPTSSLPSTSSSSSSFSPSLSSVLDIDLHAAGELSEHFYEASVQSIPIDLALATDFNYKRAKAILAMLAIQYGYSRTLCSHLGDYITICGIDGFHTESRWPAGLNAIEIQERRRLVSQVQSVVLVSDLILFSFPADSGVRDELRDPVIILWVIGKLTPISFLSSKAVAICTLPSKAFVALTLSFGKCTS